MANSDLLAAFNVLRIIHFAMLSGVFMFSMAFFFFITNSYYLAWDFNNFFVMIAACIIAGTMAASFIIKNQKMQELMHLKTVKEKFVHYQSLSILRYTLAQGSILTCIVLFGFMENNLLLLLLALIPLLLLISLYPSLDRFSEEYRLTTAEKQLLKT